MIGLRVEQVDDEPPPCAASTREVVDTQSMPTTSPLLFEKRDAAIDLSMLTTTTRITAAPAAQHTTHPNPPKRARESNHETTQATRPR